MEYNGFKVVCDAKLKFQLGCRMRLEGFSFGCAFGFHFEIQFDRKMKIANQIQSKNAKTNIATKNEH